MKFKKKPIVVDAVQIASWQDLPAGVSPQYDLQSDSFHLGLETSRGLVTVEVGDWVVTEHGERQAYKPQAFAATFDGPLPFTPNPPLPERKR